jgi:vacuolar-type H+-ATPase subunit D/Vma8
MSTLDDLEEKRNNLHKELRDLLLVRSENQLKWAEYGAPTSKEDRASLNYEIDKLKSELTKTEHSLFQAKREGRMRFSEALASICLREGHGAYIEEAKQITQCAP